MWIAKFRVQNKGNKMSDLISKYSSEAYYYPINHYIQNKRYYFILTSIIKGDAKKLDKIYQELKKLKNEKKERRVDYIEREGSFFLIITSYSVTGENEKYVNLFYNPKLIHLSPVKWFSGGWEEWEIASLDRESINKIIKAGQTLFNMELKAFYWKKIKNLGFLTVIPELTDKQFKAIEFALDKGYYKYPRDINLDELAKKSKLAFSTFQAHVRKAENKIISYAIKAMKK